MYILSFTLNNDINLWKFNIENSILYQKNSSSYINTPEFILYNSTTFNHTIHFFTGGKLFFRLGFDLYYRTKYKPDAYNPAVQQKPVLRRYSEKSIYIIENMLMQLLF